MSDNAPIPRTDLPPAQPTHPVPPIVPPPAHPIPLPPPPPVETE